MAAQDLQGGTPLPISVSPSLLYNNLSTLPDGTAVYAHKEDAVMASLQTSGCTVASQAELAKATVTSIDVASLYGRPFIAFMSKLGFTLHDPTRDVAVFRVTTEGNADMRGHGFVNTASLKQNKPCTLLLGEGSGSVIVVTLSPELQVVGSTKVSAHECSVTCVTGSDGEFPSPTVAVSGDVSGALCLWRNGANGLPEVARSVPFPDDCVTSIQMLTAAGDLFAAAFGSGQIRVFGRAEGDLRIAIAAHNRWINALAYCPVSNRLASAAEDQLLCLWRMPSPQDGSVGLMAYKLHPDALLSGCAFANDGRGLLATAYDGDSLFTYRL